MTITIFTPLKIKDSWTEKIYLEREHDGSVSYNISFDPNDVMLDTKAYRRFKEALVRLQEKQKRLNSIQQK